jgi:Tol biopolymer transport system component
MQRDVEPQEVLAALDRLAGSEQWLGSPRLTQFLRFVVDETLAGRGDALKETIVGTGVFGREPGYDPKTDPIVRVEARRLRLKLMEYYAADGAHDPVRIDLPKGTYRPVFFRTPSESTVPAVSQATLLHDGSPSGTDLQVPPPPANPVRGPRVALWALGAIALVAALLSAIPSFRSGARAPSTSTTPPRLLTTLGGYSRSPVFSPDGERIAFSSETGDFRSHIFVIPAAGGEPKRVTSGQVADYFPAWSPDGLRIAFLRATTRGFQVVIAASVGGSERVLGEVSERGPLDWTRDGESVLAADAPAPGAPAGIIAMAAKSGSKRTLTQPASAPASTAGDTHPRVSPDGRQLAFLRTKGTDARDLVLMPLDGSAPARTLTASPSRIEGIAWDPDGKALVVSLARPSETRSLWRVPVDGSPIRRLAEAGLNPLFPALAAKGGRLAFVVRVADTNIWRVRLNPNGTAAEPLQITRSVSLDTSPQFSPDGTRIAWRSGRSGFDEIWIADADGRNPRALTSFKGSTTGSPRWSPDGARIAFEYRSRSNPDIYVVPAAGDIAPKPLTREAGANAVPSWSHDGRTLYFASNRSGSWQVWRMSADGSDPRQITREGGFAAFETADGRSLIYTVSTSAGGLRRVPVEGGTEVDLPAPLAPNFWGHWALGSRGVFYAVFGEKGPRAIQRLDLNTGKTTQVMPLQRLPVQFDSGMTITADEKWLAWSQLDHAGSDIYVLDNFQ